MRLGTKAFFQSVNAFNHCHRQLKAKSEELDKDGILKNRKVQTVKGGAKSDDGEFKQQYLQQSIKGKPAESIDELYEAATKAQPAFEKANREARDIVCKALGCDKSEIHIEIAPLKGRKRAQEKADDDYANKKAGSRYAHLNDIIRSSFKCSTVDQVDMLVGWFEKNTNIVKAKNRFQTPTLSGYRDFNLCFQIDVMEGAFQHVCEVQIHLIAIKDLSIKLDSHKHYEMFRTYFAGATDGLEDRMKDFEAIAEDGTDIDETFVTNLMEHNEDEDRIERLADLFQDYMCEFDLSLVLFEKLLEIRLKKYGVEHADVGKTHHCIGIVLEEQGKLEEALEMYEMAMAIRVKALGKEHLDVGSTYNKIACVLEEQGKLEEAWQMYQTAMAIRVKALGKEHLDVGDTYNNMAIVLEKQGKLEEALEMFQTALAIQVKALGKEHSDVGSTYNNMAIVLEKQGKLEEALEMFQTAMAIRVKALGKEHLDVGNTYYNMAIVLAKQEKLEEALEMYETALAIRVKALGKEHSDVGNTYYNMAIVLASQGKSEEALEMFQNSGKDPEEFQAHICAEECPSCE